MHGQQNIKYDCMWQCLFDMEILVHGYERDKVSMCYTNFTVIFTYSKIKFHTTRSFCVL